MRVGFTGAHSVGKTSLAVELSKDSDIGDVTLSVSTSREAKLAGVRINREADPFDQLLLLIANVSKEYFLPDEGLVISERTPIDSLGYMFYQITHVWEGAEDEFAQYYWEQSKRLAVANMQSYNHICYFPPYFPPVNDGVREDDRQYQLDVDFIIKNIIDENDIPVSIVPDASVEERVEWFKKSLM